MFLNKRILYFFIALTPCAHGTTKQLLSEKIKILPSFVLGPIANGAKQKLWKKEKKINKTQLLRSALIAGSTASIVEDIMYIKALKKITEQHPVVANILAPSAIGTITANYFDTSTLSSILLPVSAMISGLIRWYNFQPKSIEEKDCFSDEDSDNEGSSDHEEENKIILSYIKKENESYNQSKAQQIGTVNKNNENENQKEKTIKKNPSFDSEKNNTSSSFSNQNDNNFGFNSKEKLNNNDDFNSGGAFFTDSSQTNQINLPPINPEPTKI